uniref:Uncharacterized protein n=1 Tax=Anguilla anguilla TaxID=7936 RepID=A0A0E9T2K4_ANGAN
MWVLCLSLKLLMQVYLMCFFSFFLLIFLVILLCRCVLACVCVETRVCTLYTEVIQSVGMQSLEK